MSSEGTCPPFLRPHCQALFNFLTTLSALPGNDFSRRCRRSQYFDARVGDRRIMLLRVAESFLQLRSVRSIFISVADDPHPSYARRRFVLLLVPY